MNAEPKGWPRSVKLLHWLSAIVVFGMFGVGVWMVDLTYYSEWYQTAPHWHKSVGLLLAAATIWRVINRVIQPRPPAEGGNVEQILAHLGHVGLYLLLFTLFVSGYLISTGDGRAIDVFNWFSVPSMGELIEDQEDVAGEIHEIVAWSLMGLVGVHVIAALKHHFINKDSTLKNMLRR